PIVRPPTYNRRMPRMKRKRGVQATTEAPDIPLSQAAEALGRSSDEVRRKLLEERLAPAPLDIAFKLTSQCQPKGDQPRAIDELSAGLLKGEKDQVLLGVTGSGKTFTVASVLQRVNRPALVLAHNKTLAAQLYQEFKAFYPENAVE